MQKGKSSKQTAVAIKYRPEKDSAPVVTAKGSGLVAERIIELAKAHGIPIKADPDLVAVLSKLDIEAEIPPSVYIVVAELLAFVYQLNQKKTPR